MQFLSAQKQIFCEKQTENMEIMKIGTKTIVIPCQVGFISFGFYLNIKAKF